MKFDQFFYFYFSPFVLNKHQKIPQGQQQKMDNPEKLDAGKTKQKHNTLCVRHHYAQTNINNVNKT